MHALARAWAYLLFRIPNRARDTTVRNLQACFPAYGEQEIANLARRSLQSTACTAMEMGKSWLPPLEKSLSMVKETEGLEALREALKNKEGVILLAPHLSNWEIFGVYVSKGEDSTFMYQPPKLPGMDRLMQKARSRGGISLAPTNRKGVAKVLKALQRGGMVGVLPDQVPNDEGGIYVPFFNEPALTMTLVSKLMERCKARVFCGYAHRLEGSRGFRIIVREAEPEIYSATLEDSVNGLNRTVERCVMDAVEQYQWEYKRFRRRPDGSKFYR